MADDVFEASLIEEMLRRIRGSSVVADRAGGTSCYFKEQFMPSTVSARIVQKVVEQWADEQVRRTNPASPLY